MTEDTNVAAAWVEGLLARGATLVARGKRLTIAPKSAYAALSDAEHATLRRHRPAIIAIVNERFAGTARGKNIAATADLVSGVNELAQPATPKPDARCEFCGGSDARCAVISDDPRRLTEHFARVDVRAHLDAQAALRSRLGWDARTIRDPVSRW